MALTQMTAGSRQIMETAVFVDYRDHAMDWAKHRFPSGRTERCLPTRGVIFT
jgi:hypothetical protein